MLFKAFFFLGIHILRWLLRPLFGCFPPKSLDQMSGKEFEQLIGKWLQSQGYRKVKFTPDTADYGVDLTAEKDGEKIGIQCKRYKDKVGVSAVQEIVAGLNYYDCQKGIVITNSTFTKNANNLAEKNNIDLIDNQKLFKSKTIKRYLNSQTRLFFNTSICWLYCILTFILNVYIFFNYRAYFPLTLMLFLVSGLCGLNGIIEIRYKIKEKNSIDF